MSTLRTFLLHNKFLVILHDLLLIPCAWIGAYWLRFNLETIPTWAFSQAITTLSFALCAQGLSYYITGSYRTIWGYSSIPDLIKILKSVCLGGALLLFVLYLTKHIQGIPRSIAPLYVILLTTFLTGSRISLRLLRDYRYKLKSQHKKRALIIGAGHAGEQLIHDMLRNTTHHDYKPIALIDDKPQKQGQEIHGIRIIGTCQNIANIIQSHAIDLIIIAIPSATSNHLRQILQQCTNANIPIYTLPSRKNHAPEKTSINSLRELAIEDLLGRDPVTLDWSTIHTSIYQQIIFVSGAGGSIGSEVCHQLLGLSPKLLVAIDHSEFNLFNLEQQLLKKFPHCTIKTHLADIRDKATVHELLKTYQPQLIFHAAAYKHVPMLQYQIREAVANNILGTLNLAQAASQYHVQKFVMVSTDKAVNPENIMGATKRAAELVCQSLNHAQTLENANIQTQFITVRFGNVLGSAGSVVPLFKRQIAAGGPVTVTHPNITRYFMTIPEASQLILQSMSIGQGGEIFVLDMGEPITIKSLAEHMIRLSGKTPNQDIKIEYTNLRPGEKLYEELFHEQENLQATPHKKILKANSRETNWYTLAPIMEQMKYACAHHQNDKLLKLLSDLVPEMAPTATSDHMPLEAEAETNTVI